MAAGHIVLMCQTEEIHESFYDLFNQRYNVINDPKSKKFHYYTNIAIGAHSKPCKVNPDFRCIVVIKKSDLQTPVPLPFLSRFEKYRLSHDVIYRKVVDATPLSLKLLIEAVRKHVSIYTVFVKAIITDTCMFRLKHLLLAFLSISMVIEKRIRYNPCCLHYYHQKVTSISRIH